VIRTLYKSKIHRAWVTQTELHYMGSITIDRLLMDAADILPHEQVHVMNVNNGERAVTYCIEGKKGSGQICLNGPTARLAQIGDPIIIISYGQYSETEVERVTPKVVFVNGQNKRVKKFKMLS